MILLVGSYIGAAFVGAVIWDLTFQWLEDRRARRMSRLSLGNVLKGDRVWRSR